MDFIKSLLGAALADATNLLVYIIIVALFIVGIVLCIVPVLQNRGRLKRGIRHIRAGSKGKNSWQQDDFLGKSLMPHWSSYLNSLFFADDERLTNASDVEDFINEETVIYGPGRSAFADAVPSLLVSLGFLGTLIGLAQGLAGFDMTDANAAQHSISVLIPGMKYAFMTSIFGVVGSVGFTLITRAVYGSTEHTLRTFYGAMNHYAGVISIDPMTQIAIYQQEQSQILQRILHTVNTTFADGVAQSIQDAVEPVNQSIKNFMTVTSKEQMRFLDAVVMRFVERMDEVIGGKLKDFGQVLETTSRQQDAALTAVREGLKESEAAVRDLRNVQALSHDMVETMSGYLTELRANQKDSQDSYTRMASTVEQMDLVARQQTSYLKTVSAMQTEVSRSVDAMTTAVNNVAKRFADENVKANEAMQRTVGELRAAGEHIENIHKGATKAIEEELKITLDSYREYVNQFTQRVDFLASSISESLGRMPGAVAQTSDQFLDQVDALTHTLEQAQQALNEAVDRLYGN